MRANNVNLPVAGRRQVSRSAGFAGLAASCGVTVVLLAGTPELSPGTAVAARLQAVREIEFIQVGYAVVDRARRTLKTYAAALGGGAARAVTVLQEIDRPDRFALLASADRAEPSEAAVNGADAGIQNLKEMLVAPVDRREHQEIGSSCTDSRTPGLYVIAHLDIAGRDRQEADVALHELARSVCTAPGHVAFHIWRQSNRGNHFDLVALWTSRQDWAAFSSGAAARRFRERVGPLLGSPYDERLYRALE